jgi:hypothetical protein
VRFPGLREVKVFSLEHVTLEVVDKQRPRKTTKKKAGVSLPPPAPTIFIPAQSFGWQGGGLSIRFTGQRTIEGKTVQGADSRGPARIYEVRGPGNFRLEVVDVSWQTSERDVRSLDCSDGPKRLYRLIRGCRMSVCGCGVSHCWAELSQARLDADGDKDWTNLRKATMDQLNAGAGTRVREALVALGATVDTRAELIGDSGLRRSYLCAMFPVENVHLPVVCYAITRVMPVWNEYGA